MKFDKLYALASTGKIKVWQIEADGRIMIIRNGYLDGKINEQTKVINGVNVGKSNETSAEEQCLLECKSKWKHKLDQQYSTDLTRLKKYSEQEVLLPMLALKYQDRKHDITFPCYVQPKLDGCRMIYQNGKCISRQGKEFTTLEHLQAELKVLGLNIPDGEIYLHGSTFQDIIRKIKKDRGASTDELEYWIYDIVSTAPFSQRTKIISEAFNRKKLPHLKQVETHIVNSEKEINEWHNKFVQQGFEGCIIRNMKGGYVCKHRSENLQKLKNFEDAEFRIIGGHEADGEDVGTVIFECETKEGKCFSVRPRGERKLRAEWWTNLQSLIGKKLIIRFQGVSEDNIPRFPVGIMIRDFE